MQFPAAQAARVAVDAALRTAEWEVVQRVLPRHQTCEGRHVVELDAQPEADAALARTERVGVLYPVAGEDGHRSVIALQWQLDDERPPRAVQCEHRRLIEVQPSRDALEPFVFPRQQPCRATRLGLGH
jgi:hypothetical protein